MLADVFENFRKKCIEIYELDPAHFLSALGLAWQACLKKTEIDLELLTNNDMLLMVEKGTRGGICQTIHRYAKANNKYMKNYDKNTASSHLIMDFCLLRKTGKNVSNIYGQKLLDSAENSTTAVIKTASKRAIQKTAEATGDLIVNKIADKITSISKKSSAEHSKK